MTTPKIKICGLTTDRDARLVLKYRADYAGVVMFFEKSKRNNTPQEAWHLSCLLGREIRKVAVCVSPTVNQVDMIEHMGFDILQVHGELNQEVLETCRLPIFRAYNIRDGKMPDIQYHEKIIGYVLDGAAPGAGETFDWTAVQNFDRKGRKLILAGGLTADNVARAIHMTRPDVVDVSSYVEKKEGRGKDEEKIREFMRRVKIA